MNILNLKNLYQFKHQVWMTFLLVFLFVFLQGCMPGSGDDKGQNRSTGPASLKISVNGGMQKALSGELPSDIDSVVVRISDENDESVGDGDLLAAGGDIIFSVPSGVVLNISGQAYANGSVQYQSQTTVGPLIAGISTTVDLSLLPVSADAPGLDVPIQIDTRPDGRSGNALSNQAVFSKNNQSILFKSQSDNLVVNDVNGFADLFLKNRGENRVVNVHTSTNDEQANGDAVAADMSADGAVVVFESEAANLDDEPKDTNDVSDVFVKDLVKSTTKRISLTSVGEQAVLPSYQPTISNNGQLVAFVSEAVLTDDGGVGVYLKDLISGNLSYIGPGIEPVISGDGTHILIWDIAERALNLYNIASGTTLNVLNGFNVPAESAGVPYDINADGRFLVFAFEPENVIAKAVADSSSFVRGVYIFEHIDELMSIRLISTEEDRSAKDVSEVPAITPSVSGDGRFVVYTIGGKIFVKDRITEKTVEVAMNGSLPTLSEDGRWISYTIISTDNLYMVRNPLFGDAPDAPDSPEAPEEFALNVSFTGVGSLNTLDGNISCGERCSHDYARATEVTLSAVPGEGHEFGGWQGACEGLDAQIVVLMDQARSCSAEFSPIEHTLMLTINGGPNAGYIESNDGGVPPQIKCENNDSDQSICSREFAHNQVVTMLPFPNNEGSTLTWIGCDEDRGLEGCTVTMNASRNVSANFGVQLLTLKVNKDGAGQGTVTSEDEQISCGDQCEASYEFNSTLRLVARAAEGSVFAGWQGQCSGGNDSFLLTLAADSQCTAVFDLKDISLTVDKAGNGSGSVTSSDDAINCGVRCEADAKYGHKLVLTAEADANSMFTGWEGNCSGTNSSVDVSLIEDQACTAVFTLSEFSLVASTIGSGQGRVTSSDEAITCGTDCNEIYTSGTVVSLTAQPANDDVFVGWSGHEQCRGSAATIEVAIDGNVHCIAEFLGRHTLNVTTQGAGTVTSSPSGISCGDDCNEVYDHGAMVTLTAAPVSESSEFAFWGGDCSASDTNSATVTMDAAKSCSATFALIQRRLTVAVTGQGTVTGPDGLSCSSGECFHDYDHGERVTLTATAAGSEGYEFTGWGGSCSDSGQVTMDAAKSCSATFEPIQRRLTVAVTGQGTVTGPDGLSCSSGECFHDYDHGERVTLTAEPISESSEFAYWEGDCSGSEGNTATVIMNAARNCEAGFSTINAIYNINFDVGSPATLTKGQNVNVTFDYQSVEKTGVRVIAQPYTEGSPTSRGSYQRAPDPVEGWSSGTLTRFFSVIDSVDVPSNVKVDQIRFTIVDGNFSVLYEEFVDVDYTFKTPLRTLKVGVRGVGIVGTPGFVEATGINCGADCTEDYIHGTNVSLTARAVTGNIFTGWSESCSNGSILMDADKTCTANFAPNELVVLTVRNSNADADSGIYSIPSPVECENECFTAYYWKGDDITLRAYTSPNKDFVRWDGDCSGDNRDYSLTMDGPKSCTAVFKNVGDPDPLEPKPEPIFNISNIVSSPASPATLEAGEEVTLTFDYEATNTDLDQVYVRASLPVNGVGLEAERKLVPTGKGRASVKFTYYRTGIVRSVQVIMYEASLLAEASLNDASFTYTNPSLTVEMAGSGYGTVTSKIKGIDCRTGDSTSDCSNFYDLGSRVELVATSSLINPFQGWSGDCDGSERTTSVYMNGPKNCVATFGSLMIRPIPDDPILVPIEPILIK